MPLRLLAYTTRGLHALQLVSLPGVLPAGNTRILFVAAPRARSVVVGGELLVLHGVHPEVSDDSRLHHRGRLLRRHPDRAGPRRREKTLSGVEHPDQLQRAGGLQVLRFFQREYLGARRSDPLELHAGLAQLDFADRPLVSHVPSDELYHRSVSRQPAAGTALSSLRALRDVLSATGRGTDRAPAKTPAAIRRNPFLRLPPGHRRLETDGVGIFPKSGDRRPPGGDRQHGLRPSRIARRIRGVDRDVVLRVPNPLRFLRVHRYRARRGAGDGLSPHGQLCAALLGVIDSRLVAALAYFALHVVSRLLVFFARRTADFAVAPRCRCNGGVLCRWIVARRELDVSVWGGMHGVATVVVLLWAGSGRRAPKHQNAGGFLDRPWLSTFFTFQYACVSMIFFRAPSVQHAFHSIGQFRNVLSPGLAAAFINEAGVWRLGVAGALIASYQAVQLFQEKGSLIEVLNRQPGWLRWSVYFLGLMTIVAAGEFDSAQRFIYFQY